MEEVGEAGCIAISGHIRPDGDCVGSVLALFQYLKKALPKSEICVYLEKPSEIYHSIKGVDEIQTEINPDKKVDVFIVLDCNVERIGFAYPMYQRAGKTINIDHHISNSGSSDVNYIVPTASSTSELIFELIEEDLIDTDIAKAIYLGIIQDTGVFKYSNTLPRTLEIASKLIQFPFDFPKLIDETFYEKTYVQSQILGRALLESILFMDGRCIASVVDKKMMEFYEAVPDDLDGIVNQLRIIQGVECAIFMYQTGVLEYKVSMRSNGNIDVASLAAIFGGGGHVRAAGCTMNGTTHDVINNLSSYIAKQL